MAVASNLQIEIAGAGGVGETALSAPSPSSTFTRSTAPMGWVLQLVAQAKQFGTARGWKRLEVTTVPLPQFDRILAFYEREGFAITASRKLKVVR